KRTTKTKSITPDKSAKRKTDLTPRQMEFCRLFATQQEFFGNGVQSYIEAYNVPPTRYSSAGACASRLLKDVKILTYINNILEETGFSDEFADKQLSFLMTQNSDFKSKLGAIREFNVLKQRVTKKIDTTVHGMNTMTDEQVESASKQVAKDIAKELKRK
ncbi:hypothetical protein KAR91_85425, partial [Candidatus Pacearchaeota archaeon]|nr:hypothetical protein [Candidatus Pacearchaeota archaeon]